MATKIPFKAGQRFSDTQDGHVYTAEIVSSADSTGIVKWHWVHDDCDGGMRHNWRASELDRYLDRYHEDHEVTILNRIEALEKELALLKAEANEIFVGDVADQISDSVSEMNPDNMETDDDGQLVIFTGFYRWNSGKYHTVQEFKKGK